MNLSLVRMTRNTPEQKAIESFKCKTVADIYLLEKFLLQIKVRYRPISDA